MANKAFAAIGTSGGSSGFMDSIKTATISDQDICFVIINGTEEFYVYTFDSGNVAAESAPDIVYPDDAAGTEAWILCDSTSGDNTIRGTLSVSGTSALTGNVTMAGNLDITGNLTFDGGGVALEGIKDEDNFASDSAVHVPTQQSTKAYIATILAGITYDIMAGLVIRPKFTYKDADEIYIGAGRYHHAGTTEQLVKWDSTITFEAESTGSNAGSTDFGTSEWHYLYIDDSAVVTAGTNVLTASEFLNSTTAPTWSASELGWYNGNDRCIFAFYVNSSGNIDIFYHLNSDNTIYWDSMNNLGFSWTTSWKDCTCRLPSFATHQGVPISIWGSPDSTYGWGQWRVNGSSSSTGFYISYSYNSGGGDNRRDNTLVTTTIIADSTGVVEFKSQTAGAGTANYVWQLGYMLPEGM